MRVRVSIIVRDSIEVLKWKQGQGLIYSANRLITSNSFLLVHGYRYV
jgi:hypothetical protein